jgi:pimeloyl-ACP methyl ester carboxylesterase
MGSFIAQRVALAAGSRVGRLVLIGSGITPRTDAVTTFAPEVRGLKDPVDLKFVRDFQVSTIHHPVPEDFLDRIVQESLKLPASVWRAVLEALVSHDHELQLSGIKAPTLVVWGDRDAYFPRAEQYKLIGGLPSAVLKVYRETGHCPHWERPEQFVSDLESFIAQNQGAR